MPRKIDLYCCECKRQVRARLTDGAEIYPHRTDLMRLPFWRCDGCGNYVGCHHKTDNPTKPLGVIPTQAVREARQEIHSLMDSLLASGKYNRKDLYRKITKELGWEYHTADIRDVETAKQVCKFLEKLKG